MTFKEYLKQNIISLDTKILELYFLDLIDLYGIEEFTEL